MDSMYYVQAVHCVQALHAVKRLRAECFKTPSGRFVK